MTQMYFVDLEYTLSEIRRLQAFTRESEFRFRYKIGQAANEMHDKLVKDGGWWYNPRNKKKQKITGVGNLFAEETGLNKSDVSRCRKFASLFSWWQVERRMEAGWSWSFFKLIIDNREELGDKIYYMPLVDMQYREFVSWIEMLKTVSAKQLPNSQIV